MDDRDETIVKAICYNCGDVDLRPDEIKLVADKKRMKGTYSFTCPRCRLPSKKSADERIIRLLGSVVTVEEEKDPPLTEADLTEFCRRLYSPDTNLIELLVYGD